MLSIVITGANSGIGLATAKLFAAKGWRVAATMRDIKNGSELVETDNVELFQLDVTDNQSITRASSEILRGFGNVDVVLNNAGYGLMGPFEAATVDQVQRQFETNVFGLMHVTRSFLPHFRKCKRGMFINVSSLGGLITYPFTSLYHSSKWAVEGFSESLAFELAQLGIVVKLVEPGAVTTDFSGRSMDMAMPDDLPDYAEAAMKFMGFIQQSNRIPATAEEIAMGIFEAATDGKSQLRYPLGDAPETWATRQKIGDHAFISGINASIFE